MVGWLSRGISSVNHLSQILTLSFLQVGNYFRQVVVMLLYVSITKTPDFFNYIVFITGHKQVEPLATIAKSVVARRRLSRPCLALQ